MTTLMRHLPLLASLLIGSTAQAADITVDGSECTLADAITAANTDTAAGGCPAGSGEDTITLEADITLAAALPEISSEITVEGGGHFISGGGKASVGPVLRVASTGSLTLNEATVTGGSSRLGGGGIRNNGGEVTLNNAVISGNTCMGGGGGIYNDSGEVTLTNSTVSGNSTSGENTYGAGIYNLAGTVTMTNSAVSGNTTTGTFSCGVGIYSTGAVTLTNSTVSGNTASSNISYGGGIYNSTITGAVTLTNSTVSGNRISGREAFGGGISNSGTVTLTNSTVSGNEAYGFFSLAGGIHNGGAVTLRSSVISGNEAGKGKEVYNADSVNADSFNVFGHAGKTSDQAFSGFTPGSSDVNAASDGGKPTELAAILSPLADNGGPTQTHALPVCSPAVDLDALCGADLSTDQRGVSRPSGAGCDAGAFEFNGKPRGCGAANMTPIYKLLFLKRR